MKGAIRLRHSLAIFLGVIIFIVGAAIGVGVTWGGHSVVGAHVAYINQAASSRAGMNPNGMGFAPTPRCRPWSASSPRAW